MEAHALENERTWKTYNQPLEADAPAKEKELPPEPPPDRPPDFLFLLLKPNSDFWCCGRLRVGWNGMQSKASEGPNQKKMEERKGMEFSLVCHLTDI